jgi:hypothetical protein
VYTPHAFNDILITLKKKTSIIIFLSMYVCLIIFLWKNVLVKLLGMPLDYGRFSFQLVAGTSSMVVMSAAV